jgi:hypothetical protein
VLEARQGACTTRAHEDAVNGSPQVGWCTLPHQPTAARHGKTDTDHCPRQQGWCTMHPGPLDAAAPASHPAILPSQTTQVQIPARHKHECARARRQLIPRRTQPAAYSTFARCGHTTTARCDPAGARPLALLRALLMASTAATAGRSLGYCSPTCTPPATDSQKTDSPRPLQVLRMQTRATR